MPLTTYSPETDTKIWTRYYILVMTANLFFTFVFYSQNAILTLFTLHIGGTNVTAGVAMACTTITALASRLIFGGLVDWKGRRPVLLLSLIIMASVVLLYNWVEAIWMLFLLNIVRGISISGNSTASGAIVADQVPPKRLSEGIGYFGIAGTLAASIAPMFGLYFAQKTQYSMYFTVSLVIVGIGLGAAIFINYEKKAEHKAKSRSETGKLRFLEKAAIRPSVINMMVALGVSTTVTFLPAYAASIHVGSISTFYLVNSAAILATRLFTGRLTDRIGLPKVVLPALGLVVAGYVVLSVSTTLPMFLLSAVILGFGTGTVMPAMQALAIRLSPPDRRGLASGTFFASMDAGVGIGSILWGLISQQFGFPSIFLLSAVISLLNIGMFVFLIIRRNPKEMV